MRDEPEFRTDLYRGTAADYDRYRLPYPKELLDELIQRAGGDGDRVLDLACGTGQVVFGLYQRSREAWAVDLEAEAVEFGRQKAERLGVRNIHWVAAAAEKFDAEESSFDLVTVGNAFHRLQRREVAARAFRWLKAGGCLALLWGDTPWTGTRTWQVALTEVMDRWTVRAGAVDRVPAGVQELLAVTAHAPVLQEAGFANEGRFEVVVPYEWNIESVTGFMFATSVLSRDALGAMAEPFADDLRKELLAVKPSGVFRQSMSFACELARRPAV